MAILFPDDTATLSDVKSIERLRALLDRALRLRSSNASQALALLEEAVQTARLWHSDASAWKLRQNLTPLLAQALHLIAEIRVLLADDQTVEIPALEALRLYKDLQHESAQIELHEMLSMLYWRTGKYGQSLEHSLVVLSYHQKHGDRIGEGRVLNNIALVYDHLGDHSTALAYLIRSLTLDRNHGNKNAELRTLGNIGILYSQMGEYEQALACYQQCLAYHEATGSDKESLCGVLNNLGIVYGQLERFDLSLAYLERSLQLQKELGNKGSEATLCCNIGDVYCSLGRYDEARSYLQNSLELYSYQGNNNGMARALTGLGNLAFELGDSVKALYCMQQALTLAASIGAKSLLYSVHRHLYVIYREIGDTVKALEHHEHFHDIFSQVFSEANRNRLAALQTLHQVENSRKETEIYRLKNVELARANTQLQEFNREKNDMLGIVAHDLKNPLNNIRLSARLLYAEADTVNSCDIQDYASDMTLMVDRMFELIDNLLDINKIETQGITVHLALCHVNDIVCSVVHNYERHAHEKCITIQCSVETAECEAITDASLVRQIVDNLLSNALKFSPCSSTVSVRLAVEQTVWRIEVQDEGPGMTDDDKSKLFTKFAKLSAKPTGNENSTGLGLSIVKKLVEALGGTIYCTSTPGNGALFTIEFPVRLLEVQEVH